jgi:hypothetical protein
MFVQRLKCFSLAPILTQPQSTMMLMMSL